MKKKILYLDMDGVLADFQSGLDRQGAGEYSPEGKITNWVGIARVMRPYIASTIISEVRQNTIDCYTYRHFLDGTPEVFTFENGSRTLAGHSRIRIYRTEGGMVLRGW